MPIRHDAPGSSAAEWARGRGRHDAARTPRDPCNPRIPDGGGSTARGWRRCPLRRLGRHPQARRPPRGHGDRTCRIGLRTCPSSRPRRGHRPDRDRDRVVDTDPRSQVGGRRPSSPTPAGPTARSPPCGRRSTPPADSAPIESSSVSPTSRSSRPTPGAPSPPPRPDHRRDVRRPSRQPGRPRPLGLAPAARTGRRGRPRTDAHSTRSCA